ncbi:hypothetical protein CTEN210_02504 [Chaetoceros tenuissimus]|uniref:Calmodulin n=1 Tax=Chaetoceros tenuissimus TaxID=426638 RepID=A0AAD3CJ08_9STRA|nr:hypothetical protein CTEN210_02504 [Chaetoceros tenuissimus]
METLFRDETSKLDLQNIDESMLDLYASRVTSKLNEIDEDTIDFAEFCNIINDSNSVSSWKRKKAIFEINDLNGNGKLLPNDLEIALMMIDLAPSNIRYVNIFEVFCSYDVENKASLNFAQFRELIGTPNVMSKSLRNKTAHEIFQIFAIDGRLSFSALVKLWSQYCVDVKYELSLREIEENISSFDKARECLIPWFRSRRRMSLLQSFVLKESQSYMEKLVELREEIVDARKRATSKRDIVKRQKTHLKRVESRKTLIVSSAPNRSDCKFLHERRKKKYLSKRRCAVDNLQIRTAALESKERDTIILDRIHRQKKEENHVVQNAMDRINISSQNIKSLPSAYPQKLHEVKIFDASRNQISTFPPSVFYHLISLRKLVLSRNRLTSLPHEISHLAKLEVLLLDQNELGHIPPLKDLESLLVLDVTSNKITRIPVLNNTLKVILASSNLLQELPINLGDLSNLEYLQVNNNCISYLPESISNLTHLHRLEICSNELRALPSNFAISSLEVLRLSYNRVQVLPESLKQMKKLEVLDFSENNISRLENIQSCVSLVSLECKNCQLDLSQYLPMAEGLELADLSANSIAVLPKEIALWRNLCFLNLQYNLLEEVPQEIGALYNLQTLNVSHNKIRTLPNEFCLMTSLLKLDFSYNLLHELPQNFGALQELTTLNCRSNSLSGLPPTFHRLQEIKEVDLAFNTFQKFDPCLTHLPIRHLNLEGNQISKLPSSVAEMKSIDILNLNHNQIKAIPLELADLKQKLCLESNPISDITMYSKDLNQVFKFMQKERFIYTAVVEEWNVKKEFFMKGKLLFNDFYKGVLWRVENTENVDGEQAEYTLQSEFYQKRLRELFFHCKLHGNPPVYEYLDESTIERRNAEASILEERRSRRAEEAKDLDTQRKADEHDKYLGDFHNRQMNALDKIERKQKLDKKSKLELLEEVQRRLRNKEQHILKQSIQKKDDEKQFKKFASKLFNENPAEQRLLPVEISPCWK